MLSATSTTKTSSTPAKQTPNPAKLGSLDGIKVTLEHLIRKNDSADAIRNEELLKSYEDCTSSISTNAYRDLSFESFPGLPTDPHSHVSTFLE